MAYAKSLLRLTGMHPVGFATGHFNAAGIVLHLLRYLFQWHFVAVGAARFCYKIFLLLWVVS